MKKELSEKTYNLCKARESFEELLIECISMAKGSAADVSIELAEKYADIIKDLSESEKNVAECCKAEQLIKAMDAPPLAIPKPPVMGYKEMYFPDLEHTYDGKIMGYADGSKISGTGSGRNMISGNNSVYPRMGYDNVQDISGRGRNYDSYREMKRHYTANQNPETQKNMTESRDRLFDDMEAIIMETWGDLNQGEKTKYMQKGQKLMGKLQDMS